MLFKRLMGMYLLTLMIMMGCDILGPKNLRSHEEHEDAKQGVYHAKDANDTDDCTACHGATLKGGLEDTDGDDLKNLGVYAPSCYQCHGNVWEDGGRD